MSQFLPALAPALDSDGNPIASAQWKFYLQDTATPTTVEGGSSTITADSNGSFEDVTLTSSISYRASMVDSEGAVIYNINTVDPALFSASIKAALDINSKPSSQAYWKFYQSGTTTPQAVYSSIDLTSSLGSEVPANAAGRFPEIYLDTSLDYKAVLEISGVEMASLDPVDSNSMGVFLDPAFMPTIEPDSSWNGTAGTGFTSTPSDPTRTTAKPMVRLIVPPNQHFTDELLVGVMAFASNSGTLINGIDKVRFGFEGPMVDVSVPSFQTITREDGSTYQCLGYWATLKKPTGVSGEAHLYVEAVPSDATMQNRVIGPYSYHPNVSLYGWSATVGAAGDHTDLRSALQAARTANAQNGLIELIDEGDYTVTDTGGSDYTPSGYITIRPADGVSSVRLKRASGDETFWRPQLDRLWFEDVEFDLTTISNIFNEGNGDHVFRHCRFVRTGGRALWFKNTAGASYWVRNNAWFMENYGLGVYEVGNGASLLRGNQYSNGYGDLTNGVCSIYNEVDDWNWRDIADNTTTRLTITYSGAGASVTLSRADGGSGGNSYKRYVLKVDGTTVLTFDAWEKASKRDETPTSSGSPPVATGYEVQHFADEINALTDFTATVVSNDVAAMHIALQGSNGAPNFGDTEIIAGAGSYNLRVDMDLHEDGWQIANGGENLIFAFNRLTNFSAAQLFITNDLVDTAIVGNILGRGNDDVSTNRSIIDGDPGEHVVVAHNSWRGQTLIIQETAALDAYSFVSNNAVAGIADVGGTSLGANNLVGAGYIAGAAMTGTVSAGSSATWYADADNLDFSPAGELITNTAAPVVTYDRIGTTRANPSALGALT